MSIDDAVAGAGLPPDVGALCRQLGMQSAADIDEINIETDMAWLGQQGLSYMTVRKLKNAVAGSRQRMAGSVPLDAVHGRVSPQRSARMLPYVAPSPAPAIPAVSTRNIYRPAQLLFGDEHIFLSPVSRHPIRLRDLVWPTVLHYIEGMKHENTSYMELIRKIACPAEMRETSLRFDHFSKLRTHEDVLRLLQEALRAKYTQHHDVRGGLVDTGDMELVYVSDDNVWGARGPHGENAFGRCLMEIRRLCLTGGLPRSTSPPPELETAMCNVCLRHPRLQGGTWCKFCLAHAHAGSQESVRRPPDAYAQNTCAKCRERPANEGYTWCQPCYLEQRAIIYGGHDYVS